MMDSVGVVTHHDAITGTEQQHVADDYAKRLSIGTSSAQVLLKARLTIVIPLSQLILLLLQKGMTELFSTLMSNSSFDIPLGFTYCEYLNMSICPALNKLDEMGTWCSN